MTNRSEPAFLTDALLLDHLCGSGSGPRDGTVRGFELAGRRRRRGFVPGGPAGLALLQKTAQAPRQRGSLGQRRRPGQHHVSRPGEAGWESWSRFF